jgi:hypothetical protein
MKIINIIILGSIEHVYHIHTTFLILQVASTVKDASSTPPPPPPPPPPPL